MSKNLDARLKEHKKDVTVGNLNNALLQHISWPKYNFLLIL